MALNAVRKQHNCVERPHPDYCQLFFHMPDTSVKILYLKQRFEPEPAPLRGLDFTTSMGRHGIDITILTGFPYYPHDKLYKGYSQSKHSVEIMGGIEVHRSASVVGHTGKPLKRALSYLTMPAMSAINAIQHRLKADLVLTTLGPAPYALSTLAIAKHLKVPFVLEMQDLWPESLIASGMLPAWIPTGPLNMSLKYAYKNASGITCLSPGCRDLVIDRGANPSSTVTMLNWAPESIATENDLVHARQLLGHWEDAEFLAYCGTVGPLQGVDLMVRAAKEANLKLVVVGSGVELENVRRQAETLEAQVLFLGQQSLGVAQQIMKRSAGTIVYLAPSELDGSAIPSKLASSLMMGVPVIVAAHGECRRLAEQVDAGPVCDPGSVENLCHAFKDILKSKHQRIRWSENAKTFAGRWLEPQDGIARYARFLRTVVEKNSLQGEIDENGFLR